MARHASMALCALVSACVSHQGHPVVSETREAVAYEDMSVAGDVRYIAAAGRHLYQPDAAGPFPPVVMFTAADGNSRPRDDMTNAKSRNVRAERIGIGGYSAGACLAALLGVNGPGDRQFVPGARVQAVAAGATPADLRYYKDGPLPNGLMGISCLPEPGAMARGVASGAGDARRSADVSLSRYV